MAEEKMLTVALAGNPNCGKTTLFNSLTGATAYVGNWPGVTVEKREGTYKKKDGTKIDVVDLPGIYSLSPYTSEEVIARNFILNEHPDVVINVLDATNLERNLYLTTQLLEMDVPVVLALNMMDLVGKAGDSIDAEALSKKLGVPVIAISALKQKHLDELMNAAAEAAKAKRVGTSILKGDKELDGAIDKALKVYQEDPEITNPLFHAIKAIERDEVESTENKEAFAKVLPLLKDNKDYDALIADLRYKYISANLSVAYLSADKGTEEGAGKKVKLSLSDKIDKVLTNRWAGIPIFIVILLIIFHLVFSEDLLYLGAMGILSEDLTIPDIDSTFAGFFISEGGIASPGVFLANILNGFTDWIVELVSSGFDALGLAESLEWIPSLICDGVLSGVFAVLGFLPQILLLFLFLSILEDSGYMARVAFILDRIFRRFGLSGRAVLPMIMGFGCGVPAIMNTRTLGSDNEKVETIRVIPFFSCGAKLPILTAVAGAIASMMGLAFVDLITLSMYLLGVIVAIAAVLIMHVTTRREKVPPFIMELPAYHMPQIKALLIHLWDKTKHFIKKAFTIIFISTVVIWLLQHLAWDWTYLSDEASDTSILASIGKFLQPLFTPMGLGVQLTAGVGWVFAVAIITGLLAKENAIATLGVLAVSIGAIAGFDEGAEVEMMEAMMTATGLTAGGAIAFIIFNMLTIPCFAAVATARSELPDKKTFWMTVLFWLVVSYVVSSAFYTMIDYPWTIAIWAVVLALGIAGLVLYDKKMKKIEALQDQEAISRG